MKQNSALCVMQNHSLPLQLTFSAGRERVSWTEMSQTKHRSIPLSFKSSFGNKPTRSSPVLGHFAVSVKDLHWVGYGLQELSGMKGNKRLGAHKTYRTRVKPHAYRNTCTLLHEFSLSFMQINVHKKKHIQNPGNGDITHSVILMLL